MRKYNKKTSLDQFLQSDQVKFKYLFPHREFVPVVTNHIFTDIMKSKMPVDEMIVSNMFNLDYLGWTAKVLLNLDLFPIQIAILKTLWTTPFPMLVASRGGGKCVRGDTLCRTSNGLLQINEIVNDNNNEHIPIGIDGLIFGENGYKSPSYGWNNGVSDTKLIVLRSGLEIECTNNHPIRCLEENGQIIWKLAQDIKRNDIIPINRDQYDFGNDLSISQDLAWWLGLMIGDGMFTQRARLELTNIDKNIVDEFFRITEKEFGYIPKRIGRPDHYNIYNVGIWDDINKKYGLGGCNSYTKFIPKLIRQSPRLVVAAFVRGLFDADGCVCEDCKTISYSSCSEILVRQLQQILLGFGIISTLKERHTYDQNGTVVKSYQIVIYGEYHFDLYERYIGFNCQKRKNRLLSRRRKKINPNNDLIYNIKHIALSLREKFVKHVGGPNKKDCGKKLTLIMNPHRIKDFNFSYYKLREFLDSIRAICDDPDWQYLNNLCDKHYYFDKVDSIKDSRCTTFDLNIPDDHSFISNGLISHNSFLLAVYSVLRGLLDQGTKITIVGAGLRQAKIVFSYVDSIWDNAPVLRDIITGKMAGPRQGTDLCYFKMGQSIVYAIPLGTDGSKIRGLRANIAIADEFSVIPSSIFDIVVRGFTATSRSPVSEAQRLSLENELTKLGLPSDIRNLVLRDHKSVSGNQLVYSGTAFYKFNHFAQRFEMWENIIRSKGNIDQVSEIFGGINNVPEEFDYKDYATIRIPCTQLPDGLLDKRQLAHAKATLPKNIYLMEYGACGREYLAVNTSNGVKKLIDVSNNDMVLSHTGRWQNVLTRRCRYYTGDIYKIQIGIDSPIEVTKDHLLWDGFNFVVAENLHKDYQIELPRPKLLNEFIFDLNQYSSNTLIHHYNGVEYLYPKPSQVKYDEDSYRGLCRKKYYHNKHVFKSSVPRFVKADHDLGLILGLYAADGSIGSGGKQLEITFNINQRNRAERFALAIKNIFCLNCHFFESKSDNTLRVNVNSRIICDFIKDCIGIHADQKRIKYLNDFTYSMSQGFIVGYWMGDGHVKLNPVTIMAASINISLLEDIRYLLLANGCYAGVRPRIRYKRVINNKVYNTKQAYSIRIPPSFSDRFFNIIDNKLNNNRIFVKIRSIDKYHYDGLVYNLEVEQDHSYFSQGAVHHNCFVADSDGFFPRSLIESCTTGINKTISTPDGDVTFTPMMRGNKNRRYVMGIDPAAERDNLGIVIIEKWPNHSRVVYCWAVNKDEFAKRKKSGMVSEDDYYMYCCSKIRELIRLFNPERIEMDSQGGGYAIAEMLRNKKLVPEGGYPIHEVIDFRNPKPTDGDISGKHILHLVQQSPDFNRDAYSCIHKSFETRELLFPAFDSLQMTAASLAEKAAKVSLDTYEDNVFEIEELKNELCTIQMTETSTGKERFDTPTTIKPGSVEGRQRKGRLKKDRCTALVLAHKYFHDKESKIISSIDYDEAVGNVAKNVSTIKKNENLPMFTGTGVGRLQNLDQATTLNVGGIKKGKRF